LLFEGLCKHWGFYFVATQDTSWLGASDLQEMIERMRHYPDWTSNVLKSADPEVAIDGNEKIASNLLYRVLVARWLVFQTFVAVAMEQYDDNVPDDLKHAWLLFQILPSVVIDDDHVLSAFATRALRGATTSLLTRLLEDLGPVKVLGSVFNADRDRFYYVLDEAQDAGTQHMGGFVDSTGKTSRPVLCPIIRTWPRKWNIGFIVSGTGFSLQLFTHASGSGVAKESEWIRVHDVGNFIEQSAQERYISRYLPAAFLTSPSGVLLRNRMHDCLRGRSVTTFLYCNRN
jgi:hypothetical protein